MFKQREARVLIGLEMPAVVILSTPTLHDGGGVLKARPQGFWVSLMMEVVYA